LAAIPLEIKRNSMPELFIGKEAERGDLTGLQGQEEKEGVREKTLNTPNFRGTRGKERKGTRSFTVGAPERRGKEEGGTRRGRSSPSPIAKKGKGEGERKAPLWSASRTKGEKKKKRRGHIAASLGGKKSKRPVLNQSSYYPTTKWRKGKNPVAFIMFCLEGREKRKKQHEALCFGKQSGKGKKKGPEKRPKGQEKKKNWLCFFVVERGFKKKNGKKGIRRATKSRHGAFAVCGKKNLHFFFPNEKIAAIKKRRFTTSKRKEGRRWYCLLEGKKERRTATKKKKRGRGSLVSLGGAKKKKRKGLGRGRFRGRKRRGQAGRKFSPGLRSRGGGEETGRRTYLAEIPSLYVRGGEKSHTWGHRRRDI